ncbi:uncharacterized protein LOC120073791 isoform X2 [Benincasa hispida]|uniref:uncharacterized protein LOC120073791 isoform X2 n=1 Tax=Benincasa hispida TaxID=102211 RepID=UPI0019011202|nr:uncharacterized protein LOC120073791 isoform X2 [Benincasa hispida]
MPISPMALSLSFIQYSPLHAISAHRLFPIPSIYTPKVVLKNSRHCFSTITCSAGRPIPTTEEEVLQAVLESDEKILPCVRTYENDLSRLTLVGGVDFRQSVTAAAADGGEAASEHLDSGMSAMVVETVFPGNSDEHSTVSTRLFLPAREVKEKARKLKKSLAQDFHSSTSSKNILAMTFRQVVLQQLWNFELVVFIPGSERNMEDLENPREVPISFTLSSSEERAISVLAETVCMCALQNTEGKFVNGTSSGTSTRFFDWFRKSTIVASKDSSVIIYKLFDNEVADAKSLLQKFNSNKESWKRRNFKSMNYWWMPSELTKLEKIGGAEFCAWVSEYVPSYRLQIDAYQFNGLKFGGWRESAENRWEVLLTHSQMVGLANILDIFYEDVYSLPDKLLQCGAIVHSASLLSKKRNYSSWGLLSKTLAGGVFLVAIGAVGQRFMSRVHVPGRCSVERPITSLYGVSSVKDQAIEAAKLEEYCTSVVKIIKDAFGWHGDVHTDKRVGAWIGEAPDYLMVVESDIGSEDAPSGTTEQESTDGVKASAQDIASYQVVLSTEGKIVGFQPTSRVAVNYWAANPLAKQLYGGRNLSPGLIETGLRIRRPNEVIVIELLMSVKTDAFFALARPAYYSIP